MLQPKISRHLALLRQSSILLDSRKGQWIYYEINPSLPEWAAEILKATAEQYLEHPLHLSDKERLSALKTPASCCS